MRKTIRKLRQLFIGFLLQRRSKSGYYAINMNTDGMGLGARIINMLEILLYCDTKGYIPLFQFNYKEKNNTTDYFKELFYYKNESLRPSKIIYTTIRDTSDLIRKNFDKQLRLNMAKDLFEKYLGFSPKIMEEVNAFTNQRFTGKRVLGVHYRGTDKTMEAPEVTIDELLHWIRTLLANDPALNLIFLSTDDVKVIQYITDSNLPIPMISRDDAIRSETGDQIHLKQEYSKVTINHDAIVNCLILSRCDHLLKTASLLSDCSVVFNPGLPVSVINSPFQHKTWWPTSEINSYALLNAKT